MKRTSTVSRKGQVTIPKEVRIRLGVGEGDPVEFVMEEGRVYLRPVRSRDNPFVRWAGRFPAFQSPEEAVAFVRELRDED